MKDCVVFYDASVTSRSKTQAREIVDRAIHICELLRDYGFQCHADVVLDDKLHSRSAASITNIPEKFLKLSTEEQVNKLHPFRASDPNELHKELACYYWGLDSLRNARFCLWDLTYPSTGAGFELATALTLGKKCFCFSENTRISSTVCGYPLNSLTISNYGDGFEQHLFEFIKASDRNFHEHLRK